MTSSSAPAFSELLRSYRKDADLTQTELAEAIGVSRNAIQYWESGKGKPNAAKTEVLCRFLKIPPAMLLGVQNDAAP